MRINAGTNDEGESKTNIWTFEHWSVTLYKHEEGDRIRTRRVLKHVTALRLSYQGMGKNIVPPKPPFSLPSLQFSPCNLMGERNGGCGLVSEASNSLFINLSTLSTLSPDRLLYLEPFLPAFLVYLSPQCPVLCSAEQTSRLIGSKGVQIFFLYQ